MKMPTHNLNINITKISVLYTLGVDVVFIHTDLPTPFHSWGDEPLVIKIEVAKGHAEQYVRDNFNIEPELIMLKNKS